MISANDLVNTCMIAFKQGGGYIWGASGQVHTAAAQEAATREQTIKWGSRWIGKRCWDCSGLLVWAFKQLGGSIFHGSNTIWNKYCSDKGSLYNGQRTDDEPIRIGTAVFKKKGEDRHHIGIYIGNGMVLEAKGTAYGVVKSGISEWNEWGELNDVDYQGRYEEDMNVLRIGMTGDQVKKLQIKLNALGYDCGNADGIFGSATKAAVIKLQAQHGLTQDGIVGEKTREVLEAYTGTEKKDEVKAELIEQAIAYAAKLVELLNKMNGGSVG